MTRSFSILILLLTSISMSISAQGAYQLEGLWEGTLTLGESGRGYPMELYLEKTGSRVKGRAYIYVSMEKTIVTELKGVKYEDFSIYIDDTEFVEVKGSDYKPPFLRKYQLMWRRSINGSTLNGHWQENRKDIFDKQRQRGHVYLKKVVNTKA